MTIYRGGVAEPDPDPAVLGVLRQHQWRDATMSCACGWSQRGSLSWEAQLNHPVHVAAAIAAVQVVRR